MKEELSELSSYRNLFSHEYQEFNEKDVFSAFKKSDVIKSFVKRIKKKINE